MSRRIAPEGATAHPDEVTATVTAGAEARMKLPGSPNTVRAKARQQPSTDAAGEANGKVTALRSDTTSDFEKYLDRTLDVASLLIPLIKFPGVKLVVPAREWTCKGLQELADEIAPTPAPTFVRKENVPYYIAGVLRDAELTNKRLRQERQRKGQSTVGRQRSSAHIGSLGPALLLDDDGNVFAREACLRALGAAAVIYSSYSFGSLKGSSTEPSVGGRVILFLNKEVSPSEYGLIWDATNHLLGGGFDEHGRSSALCYGRHARPSDQAPFRRLVLDGAALDTEALLELGKSLKPERGGEVPKQTGKGVRKRILIDELEKAQLMGKLRSSDDYGEWVAGAAAFKRAFPDDFEAAFRCFDAWSTCSTKYPGTDPARRKFDQVTADYEGTAAPLTLDMLHWRARRRAEAIIRALYPTGPKAAALEDVAPANTDAATIWPKGGEPIPPNTVSC